MMDRCLFANVTSIDDYRFVVLFPWKNHPRSKLTLAMVDCLVPVNASSDASGQGQL